MRQDIRHQFFFPHSPKKVWQYLTTPELMEKWLMKNNFKPAVGHEFQFTTKPIPALDFDGIVYCTVLELVPLKKLSYSWKSGPEQGNITLDSTVVWTLEAKDGGTELSLVHSGFGEGINENLYNGLMKGWSDNIQKILKQLNTTDDEHHNA